MKFVTSYSHCISPFSLDVPIAHCPGKNEATLLYFITFNKWERFSDAILKGLSNNDLSCIDSAELYIRSW